MLSPGDRIGPYELLRPLGQGGMGMVWAASKRKQQWAKAVALKLISPTSDVHDPGRAAQLFQTEAQIAACLSHPNIVSVTDYDKDRAAGVLWIEQELVDGADLAFVSKRTGQLGTGLALYVVQAVLKALRHGYDRAEHPDTRHALRVVHRDVKPKNVLLSRHGFVKLADFGVAKMLRTGATAKSHTRGTFGYIAPEVLLGSTATHRSDLFCAGIILWELLAGRRLFAGRTEGESVQKTLACEIPPLGAEVDSEVERVVWRLAAKNVSDRYQSADEALGAIARLVHREAAGEEELAAVVCQAVDDRLGSVAAAGARSPQREGLTRSSQRAFMAAATRTAGERSPDAHGDTPSPTAPTRIAPLGGRRSAPAAVALAAVLAVAGLARLVTGNSGDLAPEVTGAASPRVAPERTTDAPDPGRPAAPVPGEQATAKPPESAPAAIAAMDQADTSKRPFRRRPRPRKPTAGRRNPAKPAPHSRLRLPSPGRDGIFMPD
jgi:hypothetical protein